VKLHRPRPAVIKLPEQHRLHHHRYLFEGERYILQQASWSTDGDMQLSLITEASFIERNEIRKQRNLIVRLLRRQRQDEASGT
jgi:hypothetical protein